MKKRVLSFIICVLILISALPFTASASTTKLVAITFDDGPSKYTETLLDGLATRGAKATFFIVGNMANSRMSTVHRMVAEGHQIANHTNTHPNLANLSATGVQNELNACRNYLVQAGGEQTYLLRPPYGSHNSTVRANANAPLILWSVDTLDWKYRNADTVYNNIINNTTDGSIILLHDLYSTSVQGALRAIDTLQSWGYEFVTVNELFRRRAVTLENGKTYSAAYNKGITLPADIMPEKVEIHIESVFGGKKVSLTCPTKDTTIYYTTDGSDPTDASIKYNEPFTLKSITQIKAIAYTTVSGEVSSKSVWVEPVQLPKINYENKVLTLTPVEGATVHYTTDGSNATDKSTIYGGEAITVSESVSLYVRMPGKADNRITYTLTKYGVLLSDIKVGTWYYNSVSEAMNLGIMKGTTAHEFSPKGNVTRSMFTTVIYRMSGETENTYPAATFTDIKTGTWYNDALNWAQSNGVIEGVSATEFAPDRSITREEMCTMLARYFKHCELELALAEKAPFADDMEIADWAKESVDMLYRSNLVNGVGDNKFAPKNTATRAECAKLTVEAYNILQNNKSEE